MQHVQQPSSSPVRPSVASRDVPKSPKQPTERRLDEEALSRMDDEGGSNDLPVNPPGAATNASGD